MLTKLVKILFLWAIISDMSDYAFNRMYVLKSVLNLHKENGKFVYKTIILLFWIPIITMFCLVLLAVFSINYSLTIIDAINNALGIFIILNLN